MNTADTGFMQANGAWGNRFELGYIDTDNYGWMASVLDHVSQGQFHKVNNAEVEFDDPNGLLTGFVPNVGQLPGIGGAVLPIGKCRRFQRTRHEERHSPQRSRTDAHVSARPPAQWRLFGYPVRGTLLAIRRHVYRQREPILRTHHHRHDGARELAISNPLSDSYLEHADSK